MIIAGPEFLRFAESYFKLAFPNAVAFGLMENDKIQGCVIFNKYELMANGSPCSMEASVIVLDKKCVTRYNLRKLFAYCFVESHLKSLIIRCGRKEKSKRRLIERMGFHYEGIERERWPFGGDAFRYSMLPHECKWL